ncbi:MAG: outer membrane lipoprotein-sorting protein [Acidobacteriota bacterium]
MFRCLYVCVLGAVLGLSACNGSGGGSPSPVVSPTPVVSASPVPPADELLRRVATQEGATDSTSEMRLVIESDGGREQVDFRLRRRYTPEAISTLLEVTGPREETDKALLTIERPGKPTEAFSYLAGLKKVAKLSSMSALTLRGTKITIQELLWLELTQYTAGTGERAVDGETTLLKYTLTAPADRNLAFPQIVAMFRESDLAPAKFELYGQANKLQKIARIDEVKKIDGRLTMTRIAIDDQVQKRKLMLSTNSVTFNTGLSAKLFTERNLISLIESASSRLLEGK